MTTKTSKYGIWLKKKSFRCFVPSLINKPYKWADPNIDALLADANRTIGELNAHAELVPDVESRITKLCKQIPNCRHKLFDYGRHTFMITEVEDFQKIAIEFLGGN